jgi:hypothetical protein
VDSRRARREDRSHAHVATGISRFSPSGLRPSAACDRRRGGSEHSHSRDARGVRLVLVCARLAEIGKERHIKARSDLFARELIERNTSPRQIEPSSTIPAQKGCVWNRRHREGEADGCGCVNDDRARSVHIVKERSPRLRPREASRLRRRQQIAVSTVSKMSPRQGQNGSNPCLPTTKFTLCFQRLAAQGDFHYRTVSVTAPSVQRSTRPARRISHP